MPQTLSKSSYLLGLQCPKLLWTKINEPEKLQEVDQATQHRFDEGHLVGELAKKLFPKGIDIPTDDFKNNLTKSKESLKLRKPLFEAAFSENNLYARADILNPVNKEEWDIIEVKSSTQIKEIHIHDLSFQKHCYEKAGLKIRKCFLMHINNQYIRQGDPNPKELFTIADITDKVEEVIEGIQERIDILFAIISNKICPEIKINKNCNDPYACQLEDDCWDFLPKNSVFKLYRGGKLSFELFEKGIHAIKDIPKEYKLSDKQQIQLACEKLGKPNIHKEAIKHFLNTLHYPLYFLDFETYSTAIPLYDGIKPYQQIPFQFSLHIIESKESKPTHHSFLASDNKDPRKEFISNLKDLLGDHGGIIVYNQAFEKKILNQLAEIFPEYEDWVKSINNRIIDLLIPFRSFYYYHPKQEGSASIKKVLPILTGKTYENMEISEGGTASLEYLRITHGASDGTMPNKEEIKKVRANLEKYCKLDTEGMVHIVKELKKIIFI